MRTYVCQVRVTDSESPGRRAERVLDTVAACEDPELVILPELWLHGAFDFDGWGEGIAMSDPLLGEVAELAARKRCHLHLGSVAVRHVGGKPTNTSLVFGPDGRIVAQYEKMHLYGFFEGEAARFRAGERVSTLFTAGATLGLAICFDLRFPELFRLLGDQGAEVLTVPSAWPQGRAAHWDLLLQARAVESQSFVCGAATAGRHAGLTMSGRSAIIGPEGEVLARAGTSGDDVLFADLDLDRLRAVREDFPVLGRRRLRIARPVAPGDLLDEPFTTGAAS